MSITAIEVKQLRERYGLSQRSLSALLGWGEITIHRYENGSVPGDVHAQLLRLLFDPWNMGILFERHQDRLPAAARTALRDRLTQLWDRGLPDGTAFPLRNARVHFPDDSTGYRPLSAKTLLHMMLFFASAPGGVFRTMLNKEMFYSDFTHFRREGVSISGSRYIHLPYGPVVEDFGVYMNALEKAGWIEEVEQYFHPHPDPVLRIIAKRPPDLKVISADSAGVLKAVRSFFAHKTSKQASDLSHEEEGYKASAVGDAISYHYASQLRIEF